MYSDSKTICPCIILESIGFHIDSRQTLICFKTKSDANYELSDSAKLTEALSRCLVKLPH